MKQKEGILPYLKCKAKKGAKKILPQKTQNISGKMRRKKIAKQDFPFYLPD